MDRFPWYYGGFLVTGINPQYLGQVIQRSLHDVIFERKRVDLLIQNPNKVNATTKINYHLPPKSKVVEVPLSTFPQRINQYNLTPKPLSSNLLKGSYISDSGSLDYQTEAPSSSINHHSISKIDKKEPLVSFEKSAKDSKVILQMPKGRTKEKQPAGFFKITVAEVVDQYMIRYPPSHQALPASVTPPYPMLSPPLFIRLLIHLLAKQKLTKH